MNISNNIPIDPRSKFSTATGKICCHSLLENNSDKSATIYHNWYLNGEMKAKFRIRVRDGKDIPAVSYREVETSDKGTWKVEITDGYKKILDTIIFELV